MFEHDLADEPEPKRRKPHDFDAQEIEYEEVEYLYDM